MFKKDIKKMLLVMTSLITMAFPPQLLAWVCSNNCEWYQVDCLAYVAVCETVKDLCIPGLAAAEEQVRQANGSGTSLDASQKAKLRLFIGGLVDTVRIHYSATLAGEACWSGHCLTYGYAGQTFGHDIYLKSSPLGSSNENQMVTIGHEMKHVEQIERVGTGINWYTNYCTHWIYDNDYSYEGNSLEVEAYQFGNYIFQNFPYNLTITKNGTGSGTVTSSPNGINCGSDCTELYQITANTYPRVTLTATPSNNSTFSSWSGNCLGGVVDLTTDKTCTATFNIKTYIVTANLGIGGSIGYNGNPVAHGSTVAITVTPNAGYIKNSTVTGTCPQGSWSGNIWTTGPITANCNVNFSFIPTYTVTAATTSTGGTISSTTNTVPQGTTTSFTVTPNSGGWITNTTVSGTCPAGSWNGNVYTTGVIAAACTVNFSFFHPGIISVINALLLDNETFTVIPSAGTGGTIDPSTPQTVEEGATQAFTVTANAGYVTNTTVSGDCPQGSWSSGSTGSPNIWTTGAIAANCAVDFSFISMQPSATTNAATNVTATSATLNGQVISNGATATVNFDFGSTTNYGESVAATPSQVYSSTAVAVTADKAGLVCNNTYHYRLVATNSAGTSTGDDVTFTTLCPNFTVIPTAGNGGNVAPDTAQTVTQGANTTFTLTPNTGYTIDNLVGGTCPQGSWNGNVWTTGAISADCSVNFNFVQMLPAVTTNAASNITATSATLNGQINSNGLTATASFDFGTTTNYGTSITVTPSAVYNGALVATNRTGLTCNTTYNYRLKATSSAGTGYGLNQSFVTASCVDLVVTGITLNPAAPVANGTFTATVTVKNQGTMVGDGKFLDVWSHQPTAQVCSAVGNLRQAVGVLAAGASKALTFTGLPAGIAGSKMLRAFVDSGCGTAETNEGNNQTTALYSVNQATGIDLVVTGITLNPAAPVANGTFTATVTVKNQGTVAGDGKFLDVWSHQPTAQVCGAVGNLRQAVGVVAAGASKALTFTGLPAGTAGSKMLRAFVDSGCGTAETNESNNQTTALYSVNQATGIDLIVTGIALSPVAPVANGTFTANVTVKNQGTVAGDGKFLDVWSHQPTAQVCGAVGNLRQAVGILAAGASKALTFTGLPAGIAGSKMLRTFVDSGCGTGETNEGNNQTTALYSVNQATGIDLIVTGIALSPVAPSANGTFTATITVKNQGTVAGDGKFLDVWSNLSSAQVCSAVGNQRQAVGVLAAGATKTLTVTGLPAGAAGMKMLRAFVDSGCGTAETNEGNNQTTALYSVNQATGIDLIVTGITLSPAAPAANGTFTATVTVKNQGTVAGDGRFLDVWSNQPSGQICGAAGNQRQAVGVLAAGVAKILTFNNLSAGTAGTKTLRTYVDSGCGTAENNEGNNQLIKSYTVQ